VSTYPKRIIFLLARLCPEQMDNFHEIWLMLFHWKKSWYWFL